MFRQIAAVVLASQISLAQAVPQAGQHTARSIMVTKGTWLKFANVEPLDAATAKVGDDVRLRLIRPLYVDGVLLLANGAEVRGKVAGVKRQAAHCAYGEIKWTPNSIEFADGSKARIKVVFKSARANDSFEPRPSPPRSADDKAGLVIQDVALSPVIATAAVVIGTKWVVTRPIKDKVCSKYTKDFPLPAQATVVVELVENHMVRY